MALLEYVIALASLISRLADYSKLSSDLSPEEQIREIQKSFYDAAKFPSDSELGFSKGRKFPKFPGISEEDWNEWSPSDKVVGSDEGTGFDRDTESEESTEFDEHEDSDEFYEMDQGDFPSHGAAIERAHKGLFGNIKGDMLLPDGYGLSYGAGTNIPSLRWPDAKIPYVIDPSLAKLTRKIEKAMGIYHDKTCVRFIRRTHEKHYILIKFGKGCSSYVGMKTGIQPLTLGEGCEYLGTILHELGHTSGLYHEHQREDRDQYITVYKGNVTAGALNQFDKIGHGDETLLTKYAYNSIMHYGNYAFSKKNEKLKTIMAKNGQKLEEPYHKRTLDSSDVYALNKLYNC